MRRAGGITRSVTSVLALVLALVPAGRVSAQQIPLKGGALPKFVDPLPNLPLVLGTAGTPITLSMCEFKSNVMPTGFAGAAGPYTGTWTWGYVVGDACPATTQPTYLGPVVLAARGMPTEIRYANRLGYGATTNVLAWTGGTDQTLHWADPLNDEMNWCNMNILPGLPPVGFCAQHYLGPIPAVPHLHGGEVPPVLDGGPDAWFTSDGQHRGHSYYTRAGAAPNEAIYRYPNVQEAAPLWFHDHTLGATRLNVYAGLAGGWLLADPGATLPSGLGPYGIGDEVTVPIVLQDRMFDVNGQLFFPNLGINPEHPFWVPEFVGDVIVVNGKVWPFKNVDRKRYRFLFLNGSNARAYDLSLIDPASGIRGPRMWVIGTDGGYLDAPVLVDPNSVNKAVSKSLTIMPGERYDVIVDFNDPAWQGLLAAAGRAGQPVNPVLRNTAKTPFPGGGPAPASSTGSVMQFRVSAAAPADTGYDPAGGAPLRSPMVRLADPATGTLAPGVAVNQTRQLTLNEVIGAGGPLEVLVNNTKWSGQSMPGVVRPDFKPVTIGDNTTYYSELPREGDTEVWEIVNLTADAHPIHLHLVQFQILNRQPFDLRGYTAAYGVAFPGGLYLPGFGPPLDYNTGNPRALGGNPDVTQFLSVKGAVPPLPQEAGWKDTVVMYPGEVTRIAVRWAPTDVPAGTTGAFAFDPNAKGQGYVWHCHIIDHEDNEMMRPTLVTPMVGAARTYLLGTQY